MRIAGMVSREEGLRLMKGARRPGSVKNAVGQNKTEAQYAAHLELQKRAGAIRAYAFEAERLRLALRTFYTPDFQVLAADGVTEFHEVKGRKGKRFHSAKEGVVKAKVAADRYRQYRFFFVWPAKGGGWCREEIKSAEGVEEGD